MEQDEIRAVLSAVSEGKITELEQLLELHSISVRENSPFFPTPFLNLAIQKHQTEMVTWLLEKGASTSNNISKTRNSQQPLYTALVSGQVKTAQLLIRHGCKFNDIDNHQYLFITAVRDHNIDMIDFLLELGINIKEVDKHNSIIEAAIRYEDESRKDSNFIDLLIKYGAEINCRPGLFDKGILVSALQNDRYDLFKHLLKLGADPKNVSKNEGSVLFAMIELQNPSKADIKCMLDMGVDIEARNDEDETALFVAAVCEKVKLINHLVELGANVHARDEEDDTALHITASQNNVKATSALLANGASCEKRNKQGRTALHCAVFNGHTRVSKILIEHGANVDVKSDNGLSAYDYCKKLRTKSGHTTLIAMLESASQQHDSDSTIYQLDLEAGEPWSEKARADIDRMSDEQQNAWCELLSHAALCTSSKPTKTWQKNNRLIIEKLGKPHVERNILEWLPLLSSKRTAPVELSDCPEVWQYTGDSLFITPYSTTLLKGLIWSLMETSGPSASGVLRNVAQTMYKKVPEIGMRNAKIANAAVYSLSYLNDDNGVKEIVILRSQTKYNPALVNIERVFDRIASERNVTTTELAELAMSDYELTSIGGLEKEIGKFCANLQLTSVGKTHLTWHKGGKIQKSVPAEVKRTHADEVKQLKTLAKDIEKASLSFRDNLEQTYLKVTSWDIKTWQQRYIDHPLGGYIGRRMIWQFIGTGDDVNGIWVGNRLVDIKGEKIDLQDINKVHLWHPIYSNENEILAWRNRLTDYEISQPIRQAFREIYILTDAERNTYDHSLRFASHILKQHQFNALAKGRRWSQTLGGSWDGGYETAAERSLADTGYRIVFETSPCDEDELTDSGLYIYVSTGKIAFYAREEWEPVAIADIPPVIFSELMRDVDLFVSVASVGNDPNWELRAENPYWNDFSFGDLSTMAQTRKQVLETIIPKLKIAKQLKIEGRYLIVEGKIRHYKIHIGSGNILMEPDSAYLCIVAARDKTNGIYIPFEGDLQLSLILSKAFLLAADNKIKDELILSQIKRT